MGFGGGGGSNHTSDTNWLSPGPPLKNKFIDPRTPGNNSGHFGVWRVTNSLILMISGATARLNAAFGQGTAPILLDDVRCRGLEYRLIECSNRGIEVEDCNHNQDAGVRCVAGEEIM